MTSTVWDLLDVSKFIYLQTSPFFFGFFVLFYYTYNFKNEKRRNNSFNLWECIAGGFPIGYLTISWLSYIICSVFYGKITIAAIWISYGLLSLFSLYYCVKSMLKLQNVPNLSNHLLEDLFTSKLLILLILMCGAYFTSVFSTHMLSVTVDEYDEGMIRWWSGGSVWADLAYHLSIIMSFLYGENSTFSLFSLHKSPIYAGEPLSYPFIPNFHSTCLIASGMTIRDSMLYSSIFLSISLTILLFLFTRRFYRGFTNNYNIKNGTGNAQAFFAVLLFYFAGGVGFLSFFKYPDFYNIMNHDWIQFDQNNVEIYWFAVFSHILLPQRTAMYAYPLVVIVFTLIFLAINQPHEDSEEAPKNNNNSNEYVYPQKKNHQINANYFLLAGILTGTLPLVHAHSFISIFFVTATYTLLHLRRSFRLSNRWSKSPVKAANKAKISPPSSPKKDRKNDQSSELRNRKNNDNNDDNKNKDNNKEKDNKEKVKENIIIKEVQKEEGLFDYWIIFAIPIFILFAFQIPSYMNRLLNGDSDGHSFVKLFDPIWRHNPWSSIFYAQYRTFIRWLNHNQINWIAETQLANAENVIDVNFFIMWFRALGLFLPFYFFAYFQLTSTQRKIYISFLSLFIVSNFIIFQPWDKDNTKVFVIWLFVASISVVMKLSSIFSKFPTFSLLYLPQNFGSIKNFVRCVLGFIYRWLVVFIFISLIFSGVLMSIRENSLHNWEYMNTDDFELGDFVKRYSDPNDIFLIPSRSHIHPVTNLAGRSVLFGYEGWIHSHGYKSMHERNTDIHYLITNPDLYWESLEKYNISFIVFSDEMTQSYTGAKEKWFKDNVPLVFSNHKYRLFDTRKRVRRNLQKKKDWESRGI